MTDDQSISGRQIAAARALLGWGLEKLADAADMPVQSLRQLEAGNGGTTVAPESLEPIVQALQSAGISFIEDNQTSAAGGPGLRLLKSPGQFDTDQSQTVQYKEHLAPDAPTGAGG